MNEQQSFYLLPEAARDITEIWEFIAADNLGAATRFRQEIFEALELLGAFPHQGHCRWDLTSRSLRFHSVRDYLIA